MENTESKYIKVAGMQHISKVVEKANQKITDGRTGKETFLKTPWKKINDKIMGISYDDIVVIAARPGVGKSAFANKLVRGFFELNPTQKIIVLYWSFEMPSYQQVLRWYSESHNVGTKEMRSSQDPISDSLFEELKQTGSKLSNLQIYFRDIPLKGIEWFNMVKQVQGQFPGYHIINLLDHTRLVRKGEEKSEEERITNLMCYANELKNEYEIPSIFLTQMNRDIEKDKDREKIGKNPPVLADIFGASSVEQFGTLVIALHRPEMYNITNYMDLPTKGLMAAHILKQREGWVGMISLKHDLSTYKIKDE